MSAPALMPCNCGPNGMCRADCPRRVPVDHNEVDHLIGMCPDWAQHPATDGYPGLSDFLMRCMMALRWQREQLRGGPVPEAPPQAVRPPAQVRAARMSVVLADMNPSVAAAWSQTFAGIEGVEVRCGDGDPLGAESLDILTMFELAIEREGRGDG